MACYRDKQCLGGVASGDVHAAVGPRRHLREIPSDAIVRGVECRREIAHHVAKHLVTAMSEIALNQGK